MKHLLSLILIICACNLYAQDTVTYDDSEYEDEYESSDEYDDTSTENIHTPVSPADVSTKKGYPHERVEVQRFNRDKWKKVVGGEDFAEAEAKKKKNKSGDYDSLDGNSTDSKKRVHDDFDEEEEEEAESIFFPPLNIPFLNYIFYVIAIGIIVYILFLIAKNTSIKSSKQISKKDDYNAAAPVEDIRELEIDRLLREAMTGGNYRLAIRIYFLGLLKKLDQGGLIVWKKDKTNRDYLHELFVKERYYDEVQHVTLAYEEVWYGDHTFSVQTYEEIIASFKKIDQKLNTDSIQ